MKHSSFIAAAALAAISTTGATMTTGITTPIGIVKLGDTRPSQNAVKVDTDVHTSIPFLKTATVKGDVGSISGTVVTLSGSPSAASLPGPHYFVVESGSKAGLIGLVTASTSTTVTVAVQPGDSLSGISSGDDISLRPAWTPSNYFAAAVPNGTQLMVWTGATAGINLAPELAFEYYEGDWYDLSTFNIVNDVVLYPTEAFIVRSPYQTAIPNLATWGEVTTIPSRAYLKNATPNGQDNHVSYFGSAGEPIIDSGLDAVLEDGDMLFGMDNEASGMNKSASTIYQFYAGDWYDLLTFDILDETTVFEPGQGYIIRRMPGNSTATQLWSDMPEYLPLD